MRSFRALGDFPEMSFAKGHPSHCWLFVVELFLVILTDGAHTTTISDFDFFFFSSLIFEKINRKNFNLLTQRKVPSFLKSVLLGETDLFLGAHGLSIWISLRIHFWPYACLHCACVSLGPLFNFPKITFSRHLSTSRTTLQ